MQREELEQIIALLLEAVTAYTNAVQAMKDLHGKALKRSFALLESAQAAYEDCRQVLIAHERFHGCGIKSAETATGIEEKRRSGFKPDKGPQQSFHLSRSFDAESGCSTVADWDDWATLWKTLQQRSFRTLPNNLFTFLQRRECAY
jgi:hypothetical protein